MRTRVVIICTVILALCLWLLLHYRSSPQKSEPVAIMSNQQSQSQPPKMQAAQTSTTKPPVVSQMKTPRPPLTTNEIRERILADWQKPIDFYGKVIDENSNPVEEANIQFVWAGFADKVDRATTTSDAEGLFSLHGKTGQNLHVSVNKQGYYVSRMDKFDFQYSLASDIYTPEEWNPVVFHLHSKGRGASLVTSDYGVRPDFPILIPRDGQPINVDLLQRKVDGSGDLQISQIKPEVANLQQATNWSFHMKLADGGFIEENDPFDFTAPEGGYQSAVNLDFQKDSANWATQISKDYYIMFGQPPKYGWLHVDANIAQQTVFLKYAINPTGSRNLEPAP